MAQEKETQTQPFDADVSKLLDIVINALYTNQDVFLRELISNAADACDKLRYEAIQKPELIADQSNFRIHVYKDTDKRQLIVVDNGIGMSKAEMVDNLGTIAKSGTQALMQKMEKAKDAGDLKLIGQFGVGFYASFMVAHHVDVISRKAGGKSVSCWSSDGKSGYEITKATPEQAALLESERGTAIVLSLKDSASDFLVDEKIRQTVEQYSDHIDFKIFLNTPAETNKGEGQPINKASALWARSKNEITEEQYIEFYKHLTFGVDEPSLTSHWRAEGKIEFTALLYCPTLRPFDLYDPGRQGSLKLYVRRVFISDSVEGLSYPWLRFVRGVVDSEDLPLNISRETLQYNPLIAKIRTAITKRILSDLEKLSRNDEQAFLMFWGQFGAVLKEGLYDAPEHRDGIFKLCRFASTNSDKLTSLADYVERMGADQKEIYYITGENLESLKNSPQIEGFKARGIEVLFFTDTIDDFWLPQVPDFDGKEFKSVTKGDIDFSDSESQSSESQKDAEEETDFAPLTSKLFEILSDEVSNVRISKRLTDSPVCLVADDAAVDMNMERVLKIHQNYEGGSKPVLEINGDHDLIKKIAPLIESDEISDAAHMLLDQAKIIQGQAISNPSEFVKRLSNYMNKAL